MSEETTMSLVPYEAAYSAVEIVRPLVDPQAAKAAIAQYEALKQAIQQPGDIQMYQGRPFLKKRFWRRVATCFGLSLDFISEQRGFDEAGRLYYSVFYRAVAPNGRGVTSDGYCSTAEKGHESWPEHTVRATAHTRAKNRAISDLVGGGEVSAEEMPDEDEAPPRPAQAARKPMPPRQPPVRVQDAPTAADDRRADAFNDLRARANAVGIRDNDWTALAQSKGGTADASRITAPGLVNLERHIAGLEAAQTRAGAAIKHANPAPSEEEMAEAQADYTASQAADGDATVANA